MTRKHDFVHGPWEQEGPNRSRISRCSVCQVSRKEVVTPSSRRPYYQRPGTTTWVTSQLTCGDTRVPKSREDREGTGLAVYSKPNAVALADSLLPTEPQPKAFIGKLRQEKHRNEAFERHAERPHPMTSAEAALTECFVVLKAIVRSIGEQGLLEKLPANERQMLANYFESKGYKDWYEYLKKF